MAATNRYHALLHDMLFDARTSDLFVQFVAWRRAKAHAIDALLREGEESVAWTSFREEAYDGFEHRLLSYLRSGIDQEQIRRNRAALLRMRKVHARRARNEFRGRSDLQPLVKHGMVYTLDALALFYSKLDHIAESSKPMRFANASHRALEKKCISKFVRIAKKEQEFYGDIAIISNRLGLPRSMHDYAAAHKKYALQRKAERGVLFSLAGAAALALGVQIGAIIRPPLPNADVLGAIIRPPPPNADVLDQYVAQYIEDDHLVEHALETQLERRYGFDIVGPYTPDDLIKLEEHLDANYSPEVVRLLGLRRIVIFDRSLRGQVDYIGKAIRDAGQMRLFSGTLGTVVDHEITHFQTFTHERTQSDFVMQWREIAGPYTHVKYEVGPQERGSVACDPHYSDGQESNLPRHGYIRAYGGINYHEDIATFVETARFNSLVFILATQDFDIYEHKIALLHGYRFISDDEFSTAAMMIRLAREKIQIQHAQNAAAHIPNRPEAL